MGTDRAAEDVSFCLSHKWILYSQVDHVGSDWSTVDLVAGSGSQRGYFLNVHQDGNWDTGSFEGKVTTTSQGVTLEGSWYSGGTGKLKGLTGGGTYKGRLTSPTEVEMTWDGVYQLVSSAAQ